MNPSQEMAACRAALDAIATDAVRGPNMPVHNFIQEAEDLHHWCQKDKDSLTGAGLDWNWVEELPLRARVLREAASNWFRERHNREQAEQEWNQASPRAYEHRDRLLRAMRYAYRNDASLLKRVAEIAAGSGHADMIQDLSDIALLGQTNPAPLQAIKLDLAELDTAATLSAQMGQLLAQVNGDRLENSSAKDVRDRAFVWLKQAVDEVRACGQYVFFDNAERRVGYASQYFRARKPAADTAEAAPAPTTAAPEPAL